MNDLLSIAVSNAVAATVLALAVPAVGAVYRRPALIHGLWLLVLLKLVTPPLLFLPVSWPAAVDESPPREIAAVREEPTIVPAPVVEEREPVVIIPVAEEAEPSQVDALGALTQPRSPMIPQPSLWPRSLSIIWGVGALGWFLLALKRLHRFRRLIRCGRPASAALQERTRRLADSLGLKRCPRVRLLPGRIAPMLWAIGGPPRLLVPADLLPLLNDEQLDTLLLHELAHLRRRDHWVRLLEFAVMGLYWWHPVVWYARRELREAEEQCCDAWVVSTLPDAGRTYASALLDTLDFLSTAQAAVPPLASGLSQIVDLKRRLTMIMRGNTPRSLTWPGCLAIITLGMTVLPMLPSLHGQAPRKEEAREEIREAEKALEKAKEALERKKAELKKKVKEQAKAEQQVVTESARKALDRQRTVNRPPPLMVVEDQERAAYCIEIKLSAEDSEKAGDVNDIVEKIRKVLPEKLRNKVVLRPVPVYKTILLRTNAAPSSPPATSPPPAVSLPSPASPPPTVTPPLPLSKSSEKRINDLEKKLEKVLDELQELRKRIKESRPNYSTTPPSAGFRIVPMPIPPAENKTRPAPKPPLDDPYYAPTVPLKPAPVDPIRQ